ncbi:hypothetical protein GCK32_006062 [Trichostrongylus colubriformis]|uniref:Cysteine/serine-rich nuclear protein N-terminal domain-containing protein n=1 Tax=Trichostrongylus colubriformis TaxID=6319 RepID=A0AAN8GAV1_TRICO
MPPIDQVDDIARSCICSVEASSSTQPCPSGTEQAQQVVSRSSAIKTSVSAVTSTTTAKNKSVRFKNVSVYYFARTQGTSTVPKNGEVSLGMVDKHFTKRQFPLWFGRRPELTLTNDSEESLSEGEDPGDIFDPEGHERCTAYQLPTLEGKARIKMLKRSGVQGEGLESLESIRQSRLLCGCQCENGVCNPETCQCAVEGIVCQVDGIDEFGSSHPCSCTSVNCRNPEGRIEFDVSHVKNHCRMTILRTKHAEQSILMFFQGLYDSPQRIRFNSEGDPESTAQMCILPKKANTDGGLQQNQECSPEAMDDPPTRKFPVTPIYKRSKQKRSLRVELAMSTGSEDMPGGITKFPAQLLQECLEED